MTKEMVEQIASQMIQAQLPDGAKLENFEVTSFKIKPYSGKFEGRKPLG